MSNIILENQFGEVSENVVTGGDMPGITSPLATVLTGLVAGTNTPIAASDTILAAFAKLQAQIDAL